MKIRDFFQKGYYINLDRRTDRREHFEAEMRRVGLEGFFERVPGIEAPADIGMLKHGYYGDVHHSILKRAKEAGYERIVLFEDDMMFYDDGETPGLELVERSLDQLQKISDWDIIYFGGHPTSSEISLVDENLCKLDSGVLTTHAMGYHIRGIEKTLPYVPYQDSAIDQWLACRSSIQKYMTYPLACPQIAGVSDLDAWGSSPGPLHFVSTYYSSKYIKQY